MARVHYWQYLISDTGEPVAGASISVFLAGTDEPANVYLHPSEENVNGFNPQVYTNNDGFFEFWIGDTREQNGYTSTQKFKLKWESVGTTDGIVDNLDIFPPIFPVDETSTDTERNRCISDLMAKQWEDHRLDKSNDSHPAYIRADGTRSLTNDWNAGPYAMLIKEVRASTNTGLKLSNKTGTQYIIIGDEFLIAEADFNKIKIKGVEVTASGGELSQLHNRSVGGSNVDDIVTIGAQQSLSNKNLIQPKINSGDPLTATSTDLNLLTGRVVGGTNNPDILTVAGTQSISNKTLIEPRIQNFKNATHDHMSDAQGGVLGRRYLARIEPSNTFDIDTTTFGVTDPVSSCIVQVRVKDEETTSPTYNKFFSGDWLVSVIFDTNKIIIVNEDFVSHEFYIVIK